MSLIHCMLYPKRSKPRQLLPDEAVEMQSRVEDNPGYKEACKRCHKSFFHQLPYSSISFFIHSLEVYAVQIHYTTVNSHKPAG